MHEAKAITRMIQANIVDLGYFSTNRFIRIADTYKQLKIVSPNSSFSGINYRDHLSDSTFDNKWIQVTIFASAILTFIAFILWGNNLRLKAKVKENTIRLEKANQSMTRYLNVINQYINSCVLSPDLTIIDVSEAWCRTLKTFPNDLMGSNLECLISNISTQLFSDMKTTLASGKEWAGELQLNDTQGNILWFDISAQLEKNDDTQLDEITLIAINISDHKRIEILSLTDSLTGLANRRHFDAVIDNELRRLQRNQSTLSLLMLDVDFFKQYNDTYGHQKGDTCLQAISSVLAKCAQRPADLAARYGGEEFILLLPEADIDGAYAIAHMVMTHLAQLKIEHTDSSISPYVTLSIGIATVKSIDVTSAEDILRIADEQLYKAKSSGRNKISSNIDYYG
tara:strand:+ start:1784 stop:2974 length:1191 start_codon:yes stop_codon:yes gene_type:complete